MILWARPAGRWAMRVFPRMPSLIALLILLAAASVFSPTAADGSRIFLQIGNLTDVLRQVSLIGIISLGMTLVILTGGIDLSVGSVLALATARVAWGVTHPWVTSSSPALQMLGAIALAMLACAAVGIANGIVIGRLRVQ